MTSDCIVSIIIPSYNSKSFIAETLASAFNQTHRNFEVIVVDDVSTDGSWELLHELKEKNYRELKILCHENRVNSGESLTRALGFANSRGKYIAFLDSDDVFHPNKIKQQVLALESNPDCTLCHTAADVIGDTSKRDWFRAAFNENPARAYWYRKLPDYLYRNRICASSVMIRSETLRKIHFATFTGLGFGDWFTWSLLAEHGKYLFLAEELTFYRVHESSKTDGFSRNRTKRLFALLEYKLSLLTRTESGLHAIRVLFSTIETLRLIVVEYLWDPADAFRPSEPIRSNAVVRTLLGVCKVARLFSRPH